jgi:RNA polymerase sigma factor (sigma-70 family)
MEGVASNKQSDRSLTRESFDKLLTYLDPDREQAGEKYLVIHRKLVKFFEWRGADSPDELADETLNRVARKISQGEAIQDVGSYCGGIARLLFLEHLKERERESTAIEQLPPPVQELESDDEEIQMKCFESCMASLPPDNRELIIEYYQDERSAKIERRRRLAERLGMPLNALRIRAHRIRAKLEDCVRECKKNSGN